MFSAFVSYDELPLRGHGTDVRRTVVLNVSDDDSNTVDPPFVHAGLEESGVLVVVTHRRRNDSRHLGGQISIDKIACFAKFK